MSLPITVPYTFATATTSIPLSQLDTDISTVYSAVNGIANGTNSLANVSITGGGIDNVTIGTTTAANGTFSNLTATTSRVGNVATGTWNATAIDVAHGGTGLTSTPANGALDIGNGTGFTRTTLTAGSNITITNGVGSITIASTGGGGGSGTVTSVNVSGGTTGLTTSGGPVTTSGTITIAGTLAYGNGGTGGTATPTAGTIPYGTGTALAYSAAGTSGQVLTSGGSGAPTWTTVTSTGTVTSVNVSGGTTGLTYSGGPVTTSGTITMAGTLIVGNGGTGAATLTANSVVLGNGTGAVQVVAPGTTGNVLTSNGTTWISSAAGSIPTPSSIGQIPFSTDGSTYTATQKITQGTAVASTSGTSIDFTGIPSWVKRVTVMFNGVSTSGTSLVQIQVGSGSASTSGYLSYCVYAGGTSQANGVTATTGLLADATGSSTSVRSGHMILTLQSANTWISSVCIGFFSGSAYYSHTGGGASPSLSGALDRVRITTVNGTDTFDAGSINILYE